MQSPRSENKMFVLKALTGPQAGVEVALAEGEYTLGAGRDDDLQFVDLCLKNGHARLRIEGQRIFVAGGAGDIVYDSGLVVEAGSDQWRELEPLDVLRIGSNAFAIGPADANWTDLSFLKPERENQARKKNAVRLWRFDGDHRWRRIGAAGAGLAILLVSVAWLGGNLVAGDADREVAAQMPSLGPVRDVMDSFPFGKPVVLRQEVDGTIFAEGYVETQAERRALHDAVGKTGIPVNMRLGVLSSIRTQVEAAIESLGVDVTYDLSSDGELTLDGVILSDEDSKRFLDYVRTEVGGISTVVSKVRTASSFFAEVQELARRANVGDTVLLRLSGEHIEASGVVIENRVDEWVGFIQVYARRYAEFIPMTSYVQLVNDSGQVVAESVPLRLADPNLPDESGTVDIDLARLAQGLVGPSDLFGAAKQKVDDEPTESTVPAPEIAVTDGNAVSADETVAALDQGTPVGSNVDLEQRLKDDVASDVLKRWDERGSGSAGAADKQGEAGTRYLPLITNPVASADRCWENSRLRVADLPEVLFWLDYLSLSDKVSLASFDPEKQHIVLEAALNPQRLRQCAEIYKKEQGVGLDTLTLFFDEIDRNPFFIRYLVRDFERPTMEIAGVMLNDAERFVQTSDGQKTQEGGSPSRDSRLMSVGDLGALLRQGDGVTPVLYAEDLAWKMVANRH